MKEIIEMGREELLALMPDKVDRMFRADEVVHIARQMGAFWEYDYEAAKVGKVGLHAELKSKRHSDGFFVTRILLEPWNIKYIMAKQIERQLRGVCRGGPSHVVGIPDGATALGEVVAWMLNATLAMMEKVQDRISFSTHIDEGKTLLLVEDFCTRGTGFIEAVSAVKQRCPEAYILPYDPVILNRGGLSSLVVEGVGKFAILPVVEKRIEDWDPVDCPLCKMGSKPIKPKATEENWRLITTSQS